MGITIGPFKSRGIEYVPTRLLYYLRYNVGNRYVVTVPLDYVN